MVSPPSAAVTVCVMIVWPGMATDGSNPVSTRVGPAVPAGPVGPVGPVAPFTPWAFQLRTFSLAWQRWPRSVSITRRLPGGTLPDDVLE